MLLHPFLDWLAVMHTQIIENQEHFLRRVLGQLYASRQFFCDVVARLAFAARATALMFEI